MIIQFDRNGTSYRANLDKPLDISIPMRPGTGAVNCFYAPLMEVWPVKTESFIGDTRSGGVLNFMNIKVNPHGNGTHTECVGHISRERFTINQQLSAFHFFSKLVSVFPEKQDNGDRIIRAHQIKELLQPGESKAFILRTLPNSDDKLTRNYSGTNPPYLEPEALDYLRDCGVEHLLLDLPSVDREVDGGKMAAHKHFWNFPANPATNSTITELIYVKDAIPDGYYLLNIQIAPFEVDASPSKPVLYTLETD